VRRLLGVLFASLMIPSASFAQTTERLCDGTVFNCPLLGLGNPYPVRVMGAPTYNPMSPGQYTPVSDATAQSLSFPTGATYAVVCAEGANHRYTWDGTTTPTSGIGTQLIQNTCISLNGSNVISNFKIIQQSASGSFTVSYAQ
jgi:hypothetical protein